MSSDIHSEMHGDMHGDMHGELQATFRPKPDGSSDPLGEAGWYLERERVRRGLSLQAAGRATGIHPAHLQAIEMGDITGLPPREEAVRMVGDYAAFLGFEPKPLMEHFACCLAQKSEAVQQPSSARIIPFPLIERLRAMSSGASGVVASALAGVLLFGGLVWAIWPGGEQAGQPAQVAQKAQPVMPPVEGVAETGEARQVAASTQQREEPLNDAAPAATAEAQAEGGDPIGALIARTMPDIAGQAPQAQPQTGMAPPPQEAEQNAAAAEQAMQGERQQLAQVSAAQEAAQPQPASAQPAAASPAADEPLAYERLKPMAEVPAQGLAIRATERIWVRLEDDAGRAHFTGFLDEGQVLVLPDERQLRITAGNVHRLELYRDGRSLGPLGKRGADLISVPVRELSLAARS